MGSILISKPVVCLRYMNPLFHPRAASLTPLKNDVISLFKVSKRPNARLLCTKGENRGVGSNSREGRHRDFSPRDKPFFPKSVFAAGTAKRTTEFLKRKAGEETFPQEEEEEEEERRDPHNSSRRHSKRMETPDRPLTASEWSRLRHSCPSPERFDLRMMSSLLAEGEGAELDVAKSLLAWVAVETGTLSYELLLRYLTLCVGGGHHAEVFDLYDLMRGRFQTLDTGAYSLMIKGFSRTERWRESLAMLEEVNRVITPSARNYGDAIAGAVHHGDAAAAWACYDEALAKGLVPLQETWLSLFRGGVGRGRLDEDRLRGVLLYMRDNQIYPQEPLARAVTAWFQSLPDQTFRGKWTTVDPRGMCRSCGAGLESIQLTPEEYTQLKERVMEDVIQGRDVFNKTSPEELESFRRFVKRKPAFDVVIDGLNVANINKGVRQSETLLAVVSELEHQGQVMLVLGRKHMQRPSRSWDRHHMSLVQQKAHCFFTDNMSEDDPFLLYATLHSGNHCNFVSRDLMRDHKACMPDAATRRLFFKWQRGHQLVLPGYTPGKRVRFLRIPSYDTIVQTAEAAWHIPYDEDGAERCTYEVPQSWLCLSKT